MEHSTDEISETCESKRIQDMHRRVCRIKAREGIAEGRLEGRLEGKLEEKQELTRKLANKFSIEQIAEILEIDILEVENILKESQNGK